MWTVAGSNFDLSAFLSVLWVPWTVYGTHKTGKKAEKSKLSATVHINSSRYPLIECAAAGKKKKKVEET